MSIARHSNSSVYLVAEDAYRILMECVKNENRRPQFFPNKLFYTNVGKCNSILATPKSILTKKLYKLVDEVLAI